MIKKLIKRVVALLMLLSIFISSISSISVASVEISKAKLQDKGVIPMHLQFWSPKLKQWAYIVSSYVVYTENGKDYPAYCLNHELPGIGQEEGEYDSYSVDVSKVIDNVKVWRVIINGYPYKTPSQLGVSNKYDAFLATKQAVYCILYNYNPETRFRSKAQGADSRGDAIRTAIIKLVDIGRNGKQTPYTDGISAKKVGGLTKEGNYYSQEYKIDCGVTASEYTITPTSGMPSGAIITNTSGSKKTTFKGTENFRIKIPVSSLNKNKDVKIKFSIQGKAQTYPVFYGKTRISGTQNFALTFDPLGDVTGSGNLEFKTNNGRIQINKTDDETKAPISGVTFQLTNKDGTVISNATTNEKGVATFSSLYPGDYKLKEVSTDKNYVLNNKEFDVNVKYNETTTKNITNSRKKGNLKIFKVDKDNHKITLSGVKFDLYSEEFKKVVGTYTTDKNGEIQINNLRIGKYKLIEKSTGKWYNLAKDTEIKVEWNNETKTTIENELKKGKVKVIKVDLDNKEVKLKDVEFQVKDQNGNVLENIKTNEKGEATTKDYPIRDYEKLTITETKTGKWYKLNDKPQTVTLKENEITNITFTNEKKKGQIKVIKVDLDNKEVKIPDVEFKVYDEKGNIVDTLKTDKNGEATSKRLPIDQEYKVQETKTGKWYVLNETPQKVTLKEDEITNMTFTNEKKKGQIRVIKVDMDNKEVKIPDVEFKVYDEKGNVVDTLKTDKNGEATTKRLPIDQKYTLQETKTLENYVLNDEVKTVVLKEDQITNITFENEKIKGQIQITKVSSNDNSLTGDKKGIPLEGAIFEVYNSDDELVDTLTTDSEGKAISKILVIGEYYLKEIDSGSPYYLINSNIFKAEIKENKEIVNLDIEDDSVDIEVEVEKKGFIETQSKDNIYYNFKNIKNKSNVSIDNFTWQDTLPTQALRADRIYTGTWNEDLEYSIWYKTNKNNYKMLKDGLSTQTNNEVSFKDVKLKKGEFITEYEFRFGKVKAGFSEIEAPILYCDMLEGLENGFIFTNYTKVSGNYEDKYVEDTDKWTTVTYGKEIEITQKLPKTGC